MANQNYYFHVDRAAPDVSEPKIRPFATILVKSIGTIRVFPPPSITMLIFHGLQNQYRSSIAGMFQHCLGGGGVGGAKKTAKEEHTLLI